LVLLFFTPKGLTLYSRQSSPISKTGCVPSVEKAMRLTAVFGWIGVPLLRINDKRRVIFEKYIEENKLFGNM